MAEAVLPLRAPSAASLLLISRGGMCPLPRRENGGTTTAGPENLETCLTYQTQVRKALLLRGDVNDINCGINKQALLTSIV